MIDDYSIIIVDSNHIFECSLPMYKESLHSRFGDVYSCCACLLVCYETVPLQSVLIFSCREAPTRVSADDVPEHQADHQGVERPKGDGLGHLFPLVNLQSTLLAHFWFFRN